MDFLLSLNESTVSAFQYFFDTAFGALMIFIFSQVKASRKNVVTIILLAVFSYVLVLAAIVSGNRANIGILYTLFVHAPFLLCFTLYFKVPVSITLIAHFLTYNILSTRLFFGNLSFLILQDAMPSVDAAIATRIGWILSGPLVVFSSLFLLARRFPDLVTESRNERMLLLRAMGGAYFVIQLTHLSGLVERRIDPLLMSLIFSILLYSFIISVCMYSSIVKEAEAVKARNTAYSIQMEGLARLTDAMSDYLLNTARLRHDHRHFLALIDLHSRSGNLEAIRSLVEKNLDVFGSSPSRATGDDILDGIITLFRKKAEACGAAIDVGGVSLLDIPVPRDDLCLLLSNCLENAIESVKSVSVEERRITVSVARNADTGATALLVRNPCKDRVEFAPNGSPVSRRGEGHGYGTRSMKLIVEKYKGLCGFSVEEGYFIFRAAFFARKNEADAPAVSR